MVDTSVTVRQGAQRVSSYYKNSGVEDKYINQYHFIEIPLRAQLQLGLVDRLSPSIPVLASAGSSAVTHCNTMRSITFIIKTIACLIRHSSACRPVLIYVFFKKSRCLSKPGPACNMETPACLSRRFTVTATCFLPAWKCECFSGKNKDSATPGTEGLSAG